MGMSGGMADALTWDSTSGGTVLTWDSSPALTWDGDLPETPTTPPTHMPNDNRISAEVTAANVTVLMNKFTEINALLPFLINLTKQERIELPKLGVASLAFDEQCASYMATAPNLVPPFVDADEVTKDRNLRAILADALREAKKLTEKLDDTLMLVGSEIWMADLSFYQTVRQAARRDVPGADTIYDDLKQRFPGVAGDPEGEEDEEEESTPPTP